VLTPLTNSLMLFTLKKKVNNVSVGYALLEVFYKNPFKKPGIHQQSTSYSPRINQQLTSNPPGMHQLSTRKILNIFLPLRHIF